MKLTLVVVIALLTLETIQAQNIRYPVDNRAVTYVATVGIGSPPTSYDLIIDTGSSNTWIGAKKRYVPTKTSHKTADSVSEKNLRVEYGSGSFTGAEYIDEITLAPGLVVPKQSIGVATSSTGFDNVDGILGLGPANLTVGTLFPETELIVPTIVDNLFSQHSIGADQFGISFEPITAKGGTQLNGEISFGGTDPSKYTGKITYAPITKVFPASNYWGISASFSYGGRPILANTAGIVDSGTTLLLMATDAFKRFQVATGGVHDQVTGLLSITPAQFANLKSLFVHIGGTTFELTANALIWPRIMNTEIGGTANGIYLIVQDSGKISGEGLDFILGQVFMERFYTIYDNGNKRIGFATTPFTNAATN